jgi:hypothetical protein
VARSPTDLPAKQTLPVASRSAAARRRRRRRRRRRSSSRSSSGTMRFCSALTPTPARGRQQIARTQAQAAGLGVGCCAPVLVTSLLFIALARSPPLPRPPLPPARPGPRHPLAPPAKARQSALPPRPQESPARRWITPAPWAPFFCTFFSAKGSQAAAHHRPSRVILCGRRSPV